jgi:hypothetical protein
MLSLQEISDRMEIQILMNTYSNAIDEQAFDRLDDVFMPDAYIDYRALGGIDGRYPEVKAWLKSVLVNFPNYFHMVTNTELTFDGDTARAKTICFNPMDTPLPQGGTQVMFLGLWYVDQLVRTPKGWRLQQRVEQGCFQYNVPTHVQIPTA